MILAWLCNPRSRKASRVSDFSRRKPVAVRTTPAAPSAQPGERGRVAFGSAQPATRDWCRRGRFAQRDGSLRVRRPMNALSGSRSQTGSASDLRLKKRHSCAPCRSAWAEPFRLCAEGSSPRQRAAQILDGRRRVLPAEDAAHDPAAQRDRCAISAACSRSRSRKRTIRRGRASACLDRGLDRRSAGLPL